MSEQTDLTNVVGNLAYRQFAHTGDTTGVVDGTPTKLYDGEGDQVTDRDHGGGYSVNNQSLTDLRSNALPSPYYRFDGSNDNITVTHDANLDVGTGDFSLLIDVNPVDVSGTEYLLNKETGGVGYGLYVVDDDLYIRFDDGTTDVSAIIGTAVFTAGKWHQIAVTFDRSGNATAYVGGHPVGTVAISTASLTLSNAGDLLLGSTTAGASFFEGQLGGFIPFNNLLTASEVKEYMNGSIPYKYLGASQTELTPGSEATSITSEANATTSWTQIRGSLSSVADPRTGSSGSYSLKNICATGGSPMHTFLDITDLTVGKIYKVTFWIKSNTTLSGAQVRPSNSGGSFKGNATPATYDITTSWQQVSAVFSNISSGATHIDFWAPSSISSSDWIEIDDLTLVQVGAVAEYDGSSMTSTTWFDKQNGLNGDVTGPTLHNPVEAIQVKQTLELVPTSAPSDPAEGMIYYDSSDQKLKVYTGSDWEEITSSS